MAYSHAPRHVGFERSPAAHGSVSPTLRSPVRPSGIVSSTPAPELSISTLLPMACDGVGPSHTCVNLLQGYDNAGADVRLYTNRNRISLRTLTHRVALPRALAFLPYRLVDNVASRSSEFAFLRELRDGEVAYLWPSASLRIHEVVHRRGNPIVLEAINTRMKHARDVLDRAYDAAGLPPLHGITEARIAEEEAKLSLARAIFAPSPGVENALVGSPLAPDGVLSTSYGVEIGNCTRAAARRVEKPMFLFVGSVCIRKGAHQLLRAWRQAKLNGTLILAGGVEPAFAKQFGDHLNQLNVRCLGFVRDVASLYRQADVFIVPSFEEGDPLVTYEAATFTLPIIASPMGAGRLGADNHCILPINPAEPETIAIELRRLATSMELRAEWGARANAAVLDYDWLSVARSRVVKLRALLSH